jgi:hypothetical protein
MQQMLLLQHCKHVWLVCEGVMLSRGVCASVLSWLRLRLRQVSTSGLLDSIDSKNVTRSPLTLLLLLPLLLQVPHPWAA